MSKVNLIKFYLNLFNILNFHYLGFVTREAPKSPRKEQNQSQERTERTEGGVITYGIGNNKKTIMYFLKDCEKSPRIGDHVKFNICQVSFRYFLNSNFFFHFFVYILHIFHFQMKFEFN